MRGQWLGIEILFEPAIVERSQHSRTDVLPSQSTENLKFVFTVDEVINLRSVDAQQEFPMPWLDHDSLEETEKLLTEAAAGALGWTRHRRLCVPASMAAARPHKPHWSARH